jgi:hypothetical protein
MFRDRCCGKENGKKRGWRVLCVLLGVGGAAALIFGFAWVVMSLWNWLMPDLFKLAQINYLQALGLIVLARVLFGHTGGMRGRHRYGKGYFGRHNHAGCGCESEDVKDWRQYESWWDEEGKAAFKTYSDKKESDKGTTK